MPNSLINETSPYLLQHADNPVDWYPWGQQVLSLAESENKPILLSIGYAACHWCHVMEHESFKDLGIAQVMNKLFVCIKVDREERPDLDKIYQAAHQMLTQRPGGWPLTLAITPGGHAPFFAGTYFPPTPRQGMPGFTDLLEKIAGHFREHLDQMTNHEESFKRALGQLNPGGDSKTNLELPIAMDSAVARLKDQFDPVNGGFGEAPKFPHPTQVELLFRIAARKGEHAELCLAMANKSLRKMFLGGLFDQLGGGFFRYSVDKQWQIPHFEKMLYDNAQLLCLFSNGLGLTKNSFYRQGAARTADWVMREMQQAHGGYASTLDADSEGVEGKYYVWTETDLRAILEAAEYELVEKYYGLYGETNFEGSWHFNVNEDEADQDLSGEFLQIVDKLYLHRQQRVSPGLDDKILASWNGMMIKAMAKTGRRLNMPELISSAQKSADFVRTNLWQHGTMLASWREQQANLNGYLDDYAFVAEGLLELMQVNWRDSDLEWLMAICDVMIERFEDKEKGGFFFTSHDHEELLYRPKPGPDDAIPSSNGAAASVLYRTGVLLGKNTYIEAAAKTIELYSAEIMQNPSVYASMLYGAMDLDAMNKTVILRGSRNSVAEWSKILAEHYLPNCWIYPIPLEAKPPPPLEYKPALKGKTVAYVCQGFQCSAPMESVDQLQSLLLDG